MIDWTSLVGGFSFWDIVVIALVFGLGIRAVDHFNGMQTAYPSRFMTALGIYHVLMSCLGMGYISAFGGDSLAYWSLSADESQQATSWMEYWGHNTFFIQWLNYLPSRILGLTYVTGSLMYSLLSFQGFIWLAASALPFYTKLKTAPSWWMGAVFMMLFFLPSFHFWSGFVGKEALLWFLTMGMIRFYLKKKWLLFFGFTLISIWIRPVLGLVVLGFFTSYSLIWGDFSRPFKWGIGIAGGVSFILGLGLLSYITGISGLSLGLVREFSAGQYEFLSGYHAATEVPVSEISLMEKLFAVAFRPFPGEISSVWGLAVGMENLVLFLLSIGVLFFVREGKEGNRGYLFLMILWILVYFLSIALSVNVLGIMIRLKSVLVPFMIWVGYYGWTFFFLRKNERMSKAGS